MGGHQILPRPEPRDPKQRYTSRYLSRYAGGKVLVGCEKCSMTRRYDADQLLARLGDRCMPDLLAVLARAEGCARIENPLHDRCTLHYDIETMNEALK